MQLSVAPEPWHSFFKELDAHLLETVELHCIGGFIVTVLYDLQRQTSDVDFLTAVPASAQNDLIGLGGEGSRLHKKYGVYLHQVGIVNLPASYDTRLAEIFSSTHQHLHLMALDPYDLALSKLERNIQRDRDDIKQLALRVPLDAQKLQQR